MINIPITIIIGIIGIFITARFQRYHWLRSTREEIRVRETNEASQLLRDIALAFDKRITAQRSFLLNLSSPSADEAKQAFTAAVREYSESFNEIRYRLFYYTSYNRVLEFEERLHERLVTNANEILGVSRHGRALGRSVQELDDDLSLISAKVFRFCERIANDISNENIGSLKRIYDWTEPRNEFVTNWHLVKRLFNV